MKELFFMLLDLYLITLIFGAVSSIIRFFIDVKRFHPKEIKETRQQFEKDIKDKEAVPDQGGDKNG